MKRILLLCLSVFMLVSCENFLDTDNLTKKDTSNFPKTEADVDMLIAATYQTIVQIAPLNNPFYMSDLASDDRFGGAGKSDRDNRAIGRLKRNGEEQYKNPWQQMYSAIFRVNTILKSMDMVSWSNQANRDAVEGEVLFLRAYAYLNLCRTYGTVPLVMTTEQVNLPRATPEALWGQIASDFKVAIEKMPAVQYQNMDRARLGHATKWAAEAMMARAWLFYTDYYKKENMPLVGGGNISKDQVATWLKDVVSNSGHGLLANFWSLWPYSNEETSKDYKYIQKVKAEFAEKYGNITWIKEEGDNKENIFGYKYSSLADTYGENHANQFILYSSIRGWGVANAGAEMFPLGLGWGGGTVNSQLWDEWKTNEPNDIRRQASIMDVRDANEMEKYTWGGDGQMEETGYWNKKYIAMNAKRKNVEGAFEYVNYSSILFNAPPDYRKNNTQDTYIMRFSDVLLMLAELTKEVSYINQVRDRVGLPALPAYTEDVLRHERRYELCFEGIRYYDLLRWHIAGTQLNKKNEAPICNAGVWTTANFGDMEKRIKETGGFFPIPVSQINLSAGVLIQDAAWEGADAIYTD